MVNTYYDFTTSTNFTPYVTLGAGVAKNEVKITSINNGISVPNKATSNFAYKIGLGAKYSLNSSFDFDVRYQFVNLGKIKFSNTGTDNGVSTSVTTLEAPKLRSNEVLIGLAYKF
jgi:outer membrane autotransporter protein